MHGQFYKTKKNLKLDIGCAETLCVALRAIIFKLKARNILIVVFFDLIGLIYIEVCNCAILNP